jgi:hypothetical protein
MSILPVGADIWWISDLMGVGTGRGGGGQFSPVGQTRTHLVNRQVQGGFHISPMGHPRISTFLTNLQFYMYF